MYPLMDMVRSRDHGRVIPGWQAGRLGAFRGVLTVRQVHQPHLHRYVMTAQMTMQDKAAAPPPDLWDVPLVEVTRERWILTGFERISDGLTATDYAQTWVLITPRVITSGYHGCEVI
ncbi:hypothetical protein [Variovorax sp. dw_954]|uniref:hypothetical protein n=1 Tax=Variovorax sp. dw_954 TaxID=2720078 RepID=UPI001BD6CE90|nr:hypothetical protein [Variovorax sp. dw_954]